MSRMWCALIVVAVCAGCRNTPPVMDPFLTQQTIPPPGTATPPTSAPPYYMAPAGSSVSSPLVSPPAGASMPVTPPPTQTPPPIPYSVPQGFSPAPAGYGAFIPNVSAPAGSQVQPAASTQSLAAASAGGHPMYGVPGGMSYSPAAPAAAQQPTPAQTAAPGLLPPGSTAGAVSIGGAAAAQPGVTPAGWQPAAGGTGVDAPVRSTGDFRPGNTSTLTMPASATSGGTLNQSMARPVVKDVTDLPLAQPTEYAAPLPSTAAMPSSSNYGYDSQYRWVKGKLEYSQTSRAWRLRYIPPDAANDNYGGSVILSDASKLGGLQNGEYVVAYGAIGPAAADNGSFAAMYHVTRVERQ